MCQITPKRIKLYICKYSQIYVFNEEHRSYLLEDETKVSQRFNFYLNENLTDIFFFRQKHKNNNKFIINFYVIIDMKRKNFSIRLMNFFKI